MAPERTERLINEMREWCKFHKVKHKQLAEMLGITPQGITEIFKGRSQPTSEQALAMLELLRANLKGGMAKRKPKNRGKPR